MEGAKSSVVKSKSSNSAISKSASSGQKSRHGRQKSRSSADFPRVGAMKKRKGMYVEKRATKVSLSTADSPKKSKTSTSPPRRGKNKFLNSVLSILDRDTQGTQTGTSREETRKTSSRTKKKRKFKVEDTDLTVESIGQDINKSRLSLKIRDDIDKTEKTTYRSKVLKEELFRADTERLFIMAPKKVSPGQSDDALEFMKKSSIYEEVAEGLLGMADEKAVAAKLLRDLHSSPFKNAEPSTAMGEIEQKTFDNLKQRISGKLAKCNAERGIYNFFVDLLENSYDFYNVADKENSPDEEETKNDLYIDEIVAQKLKVEKCVTIEEKSSNNSIEKEKNEGYSVRDDDGIGWNDAETFQASIFQNMRPKSPFNRSLKSPPMSRYSSKGMKSSSFAYTRSPQRRPEPPQTQSLIMPKRTSSKKRNRKETLLNILKEELSKQVDPIEEPQNMYQALKLIAKNKKRERKEISFADTPTEISGYENHHCRFKGRKVICSSTQSKKNNKKPLPSKNVTRTIPTMISSPEDSETDYPGRDSKYTPGTTDVDMGLESYDTDSYHTLEVREYDTDLLPYQQAQRKDIFFAKTSDAFFKKKKNTNLQVFEDRFLRHNSEASIDDTNLLCRKNCMSRSASDLDSEIDDPSAISFDLPINIE